MTTEPNWIRTPGYTATYVFTWDQHSGKNAAPNTCTLDGVTMTVADTVIFAGRAKTVVAIIDSTPADNEENGDINFIAGTKPDGKFEDGVTGKWDEFTYTDGKVEHMYPSPAPYLKIRNDNTSGNVAPQVTVLVTF